MRKLNLPIIVGLLALSTSAVAQQSSSGAQENVELTIGRLVISNANLADQVKQLQAALTQAQKELAEEKAKSQPSKP